MERRRIELIYLSVFSVAFLLATMLITVFMQTLFAGHLTSGKQDDRLTFTFILCLQFTMIMSLPHYSVLFCYHFLKNTDQSQPKMNKWLEDSYYSLFVKFTVLILAALVLHHTADTDQ